MAPMIRSKWGDYMRPTSAVLGLAVALSVACQCRGQAVIESFSQNGEIRWSVQPPTTCHVEWASSANGPWLRSWDHLKTLVVTSPTAQASVPLFFRVVEDQHLSNFGLIFHMPCNGDLNDHGPNELDPTGNGVDLYLDRLANPSSAARFSSGEYLSVPPYRGLGSNVLSVALWAKFDAITSFPYIMEHGPHDGAWSLFVDQEYFYVRGSAAMPVVKVDQKLSSGTWYHLAATVTGNVATVYLNGVPRNTGTVSSVSLSTNNLVIGRSSTGANPFVGLMDDIRIYNRVLSAGEVADLYSMDP